MKFRTDIQVLRAIAVIFVVLYHLQVPGFANGLLGVDIFFAISGYLMYRIYDFDKGAAGFYTRRSRRLLPGYFATIVCTLVACFLIVQPSDFAQFAQQGLFASLFASNIGFWAKNTYFSNVDFKPLLHLWSLAVELQFYLFVPLMMRLDRSNKYVLPVITLGSLAICLIFLVLSPNVSFFMMPNRLWQFGLGMLAARASAKAEGNTLIGLSAAVCMLAMLFFPTIGYGLGFVQGHPGLGAVIATVATALCLFHGLPEWMLDNPAGRGMRYVGDISYSIYLVHFPVIVLANYRPFAGTILGASSVAGYGLMLLVIALFAWVCHQIFERRASAFVSVRSTLAASGLVLVSAILLPAMQARLFDRNTNLISSAFTDRAPYRCGTFYRVMNFGEAFCTLGSQSAHRGQVMLIGDSHSDAIKTSFTQEANRANYRVIFPVSNDVLANGHLDEKWLLKAAQKHKVQRVFLHFSIANIRPAVIERTRALLWQNGIATSYIMPVPTREQIIPQILLSAHQSGIAPEPMPVIEYEKAIAHVAAPLRLPRAGYQVIETKPALCTPDCRIQDQDGHPLYFDKHHLTLAGARLLSPILRQAIEATPDTPKERLTRR